MLELRQIVGSAFAFHRLAARSVWPRTNDLGALDLSARLARIADTTPARIGQSACVPVDRMPTHLPFSTALDDSIGVSLGYHGCSRALQEERCRRERRSSART